MKIPSWVIVIGLSFLLTPFTESFFGPLVVGLIAFHMGKAEVNSELMEGSFHELMDD